MSIPDQALARPTGILQMRRERVSGALRLTSLRRALGATVLAAAGLGCALPETCPGSLDAALEGHVGEAVSLRDLTDFRWMSAYLFTPGSQAKVIRQVTGVKYRPYLDVVPGGRNVIVFRLVEPAYCVASVNAFRYRLDLGGREWFPEAPWFHVREKKRWRRTKTARSMRPGDDLEVCADAEIPFDPEDPQARRRNQDRLVGDLVFGGALCPEDG